MIVEGKKITAFDAMEATINLSESYIKLNTHKTVNFRWSQSMEAVVFEFGYWDKFDFNITDHYTIYLDNTITAGNTFKDLFEKITEECDWINSILEEKENTNEV